MGVRLAIIVLVAFAAVAAPATAQEKAPPYWASIASGKAMMRTGPARNYPGIWLYQRRDLPVRVLKRYENWRLIEDPDGARGWMLVTLLSDTRTAMVRAGDARDVRLEASDESPVVYRAEAGVVGRIEKCRYGWCHFTMGKKDGYIRAGDLWGLSADETLD